MNIRIGNGYDVHKLVENRKLILGGVTIPNDKGLLGHSDADVLIHSIIDSILGALNKGDIGKHFPDTKEVYKNASSILLLKKVCEIMENEGYKVNNIDATIVAQKPKLISYFEQMRKNIAEALNTDTNNINIKGTTEEQLGFTGAKQGIKSYAVALLTM